MTTKELIEKIRSGDDKVRGEAWQAAGPAGAEAVKPLAQVMAEGEMEVSRAAKRALWKIVYHAGRPGAEAERKPVCTELLDLLRGGAAVPVRREVLWMVSELAARDEGVEEVAALVQSEDLREDARMVLERIPGEKSVGALKELLEKVPEGFKLPVAHSLRVRGVDVPGLPCQKLVPTKETRVQEI